MQSIIIIVKQKWNSDGVNRWVQISQTIVAYIFQCVISDKKSNRQVKIDWVNRWAQGASHIHLHLIPNSITYVNYDK